MQGTAMSRRSIFACACCQRFPEAPPPYPPPHAGEGREAGNPATGRRNFIAGGLAAVGLVSAGVPARTLAQPKPRRIDVHHHLSPPPWLDALKKAALDNPPALDWTPQRSVDDMDQAGVATAILSTQTPGIGFIPAKEAAAVARASNEYAKMLAADYPGRFGTFALVPMPYVDETLREIEYALDTLKADGVGFMTSYGDKFLGDAAFAPVMDELNRRKATAYTHPNNPACCQNLAGIPSTIIEWGTDTTRTIASLIFSGTSARCRDVNFIFSHGGGTVTSLTDRLSVQLLMNPKYKSFTHEGVMAELARFYYDTAQAANPVAMASLAKMATTSQIVFGSDYPYRTAAEQVRSLAEIFRPEDLRKIERDNALKLLPRWRTI
jgi:predicted TIM-barrel fold metal-dependent hydrolase